MDREFLSFDDYREVIKEKARLHKLSFKKISEKTKIHSSYFSRVMNEQADFSEEQLFKLGIELKLDSDAMDFFQLLGSLSRSSCFEHKSFIQSKINTLRLKHSNLLPELSEVHSNLNEEEVQTYYADIINGMVHMYLTIPRFRSNPQHIKDKLGISSSKLQSVISTLRSIGIVSIDSNGQIEISKKSIHLDEKHPMSATNHANWRINSLSYLNKRDPKPTDYHLSACFSADSTTKIKIVQVLKDAIVETQSLVNDNKSTDNVYFLGIDIY